MDRLLPSINTANFIHVTKSMYKPRLIVWVLRYGRWVLDLIHVELSYPPHRPNPLPKKFTGTARLWEKGLFFVPRNAATAVMAARDKRGPNVSPNPPMARERRGAAQCFPFVGCSLDECVASTFCVF